MNKKKRIRVHTKTLAAENAAITQFLFDRGTPLKGMKLSLQHVFGHYESWRRKNRLAPSELTIDGFGRLFPKSYPRRSAYWRPAGHALKCVFGLKLV